MDLFMMILKKVWQLFISTGFDVTYQGQTYTIQLYSIFIFTAVLGIVAFLIGKLFE